MMSETDPLQAQYDGIPVPCYTWRADGDGFVLERANREAHERAGGQLQGLRGRRYEDVYPERDDIRADLATSLRERRTVRREMEHELATTGELRRLDVSYVFVPPDRVMVHADDVTELRESEERLRAVIATIESGLLTVDLAGRVTDANPAACRILGLTREQLLENAEWWRPLSPRMEDGTPLDPRDAPTPGRRELRGGEPAREVGVVVPRPDGARVAPSTNSQPLRAGADGRVNGMVVSLTDVTEARRLQ